MISRVVVALVPLLLSGCALDSPSVAAPACIGGKAQPISIERLTRTLGRNGFTAAPEQISDICNVGKGRAKTVAHVTNVHFDDPDADLDEQDAIGRREGTLICGVRRGPVGGKKLRKDPEVPAASPEKVEFFLGNVGCTIYPQGSKAKEQVARLNTAMEEMAASLSR
jgi:hypothetical protein